MGIQLVTKIVLVLALVLENVNLWSMIRYGVEDKYEPGEELNSKSEIPPGLLPGRLPARLRPAGDYAPASCSKSLQLGEGVELTDRREGRPFEPEAEH